MNEQNGEAPRHPIRVVARRTGLTPAVLRAWEKRYGVVRPSRSEGGQRLYSDEDVQRLSLLQQAVEEGRSISQVAELSTEELQGLVREDEAQRRTPATPDPLGSASVTDLLSQAFAAVDAMDPEVLERVLTRGAMALPVPTMTDQILVPLLEKIGASWRAGALGPAQEHLSTVVIRRFLEWLLATVATDREAPVLVSATPAGERHELGALLSAVTGAAAGWKSVFLGPDLPAVEIAGAALRLEADLVALSVVNPALVERVGPELDDLRSRLPRRIHLVVGGGSVMTHAGGLSQEGIEVLGTQEELRGVLRRLVE